MNSPTVTRAFEPLFKRGKFMNLSYRRFAGIDVSKDTLDVHLLPSDLAQQFPNTAAGHRELIDWLKSNQIQCVVLEATGGYEHPVVIAMVCTGQLKVHVAQPQVIHNFAASHKLRARNDKIDAAACARFAQDRCNDLRFIEEIDKNLESLHAQVVRRNQLLEMRTMEKNHQKQAVDKVAQASIKRMIKCFDKEIESIEKSIDVAIKTDPVLKVKAKKMRETKGIGPQSVRVVLALLPELGKVEVKQLNALVGVAPYAQDSGKHRGTRRISGGRAAVRNCLYMACMSAKKHNPVIKKYYDKKIAEGLAHKSAMMGCIRKMLAHLHAQIQSLKETPLKQAA
jgi:transposase